MHPISIRDLQEFLLENPEFTKVLYTRPAHMSRRVTHFSKRTMDTPREIPVKTQELYFEAAIYRRNNSQLCWHWVLRNQIDCSS